MEGSFEPALGAAERVSSRYFRAVGGTNSVSSHYSLTRDAANGLRLRPVCSKRCAARINESLIPSGVEESLEVVASHVFDHVISKLAALDFGRTIHQTREIVGDALACDRAL
jgi:hypothetical protein